MTPIDEAVGRVVEQIRRFRPHVVVTYDGNGGYGHPDHIQTHRATLLAIEAAQLGPMFKDAGDPWRVQKLYYTAFPRSSMRRAVEMAKNAGMEPPFGTDNPDDLPFLTPDEWVTTTIDCRSTVMRKRDALRAHRSQIAPDWPLLAIPDDIAELFADEYFQLTISRTPRGAARDRSVRGRHSGPGLTASGLRRHVATNVTIAKHATAYAATPSGRTCSPLSPIKAPSTAGRTALPRIAPKIR